MLPRDNPSQLFQTHKENTVFLWKKHKNLGFYAHFHSDLEIYFLLSGEMEAIINKESYTIKKGEIFVVNQFEIHEYKRTRDADVAVLILSDNYLTDLKEEYGNVKMHTLLSDVEYNKGIFSVLKDIPYGMYRNTTLSETAKKGYANLVLDKIVKHYGFKTESTVTVKVTQIVEYIYNNFTEKITLESLAEKFNYAKTSLSRMLSPYIKTDLRKFINTLRAEKAELLFNDSEFKDFSTTEIASICGFESFATFYRAYKARFNRLPKKTGLKAD